MKNKTDFFIGLALLAFCCVMGYQIHLIPEPAALDFFSAGSFPDGRHDRLGPALACPRGKGGLGQG